MPCDGRAFVLGWCWTFVPWELLFPQHFPSLLFLKLAIIILHTITYMFTINRRDNGSTVFLVIYLLNCLYLILGDQISCFCMFVFLLCSHFVLLEFICLLFSDVYKNVHCHGPVVYLVYFFLFLCLVPHYSHFHMIFQVMMFQMKEKKSYIWSELNTIICKDACFISNPAIHGRKRCCFWPAGVRIAENQTIWRFLATCALRHIQVQLELKVPSDPGLTTRSRIVRWR